MLWDLHLIHENVLRTLGHPIVSIEITEAQTATFVQMTPIPWKPHKFMRFALDRHYRYCYYTNSCVVQALRNLAMVRGKFNVPMRLHDNSQQSGAIRDGHISELLQIARDLEKKL